MAGIWNHQRVPGVVYHNRFLVSTFCCAWFFLQGEKEIKATHKTPLFQARLQKATGLLRNPK